MNQSAEAFTETEFDSQYSRMIPGFKQHAQARTAVVNIRDYRPAKRHTLQKCLLEVRDRSGFSPAQPRRVLIVGAGPVGRSIAQALLRERQAEICGFVDDRLRHDPEVLGGVQDLAWLARAEFVDEVIVALPGQSPATWEACEIARRNHLDLRITVGLPDGPWPDAAVDRIGDIPVISLHREPFPCAMLIVKRLMDVAGALLALILTTPLMAVLALLIRLDSRGPAIYSAERIGTKGRRFRCYKFRSMAQDADRLQQSLRCRNQRQGPTFKIDNDPRITRVGRFIRRYSLDELPQFWNVLRGDMSMVGPRPHPVEDVNRYELHHYRRLDMKPGITGLWQVTARQDPSFELNLHLDLTYIENWTLLLDLRILACTLRALFVPDGV